MEGAPKSVAPPQPKTLPTVTPAASPKVTNPSPAVGGVAVRETSTQRFKRSSRGEHSLPLVLVSPLVSPRHEERGGNGRCHTAIRAASGCFALFACANSGLVVSVCVASKTLNQEVGISLILFHSYSCAISLCLLLAALENRWLLRRADFLKSRSFLFLLET